MHSRQLLTSAQFDSWSRSQISVFADNAVAVAFLMVAMAVVSARRSNGFRNVARTSPFSQEQFDSKKLSSSNSAFTVSVT